ncbi:hypothetical protein BKA66DRAFT_572987 [Pyrenochaeta sp. MPI-SDFR-AT-0127]|nr:hypothetical protein BKA66DRAFT_572987 [Pyrenochaeta sp. MPI-SDFR-AT-0127]
MDPETRLELETVMNRSVDPVNIGRHRLDMIVNSSSTELIDTKHSTLDNAHGHIQTNSSGTREFMRLFKLQIFSLFWAWKAPLERPKVAIYGNRSIAALHALLHVVPLGGAIPLLVLNWTSYFIGLAPPDARSLQFAAKFHEILMQASIFEIILAIIRSQIVEDYVPLGALSASMQASQLSYIWSLDFVAAVAHSASHGWRKMLVVAMILLLTILTALVGPSSAVLMIPRAGLPHVLETVEQHANISTKELFPDRVNKTHNMNLYVHIRGLGQSLCPTDDQQQP